MKQPQKLGCLCIGVLLFAAQSLSAQETPERAWSLSLLGAQARFTWRVPLFVRLQYQAGLTDASVGESARSQAFSGVVGLTIFRW